jgi:hypothetical protein
MNTTHTTDTFPVDWNEWESLSQQWFDENRDSLFGKKVDPGDEFTGVNFLADERIGTWRIGSFCVELSEVVFPDLSNSSGDRKRYVGMVWCRWGQQEDFSSHETYIVDSFKELANILRKLKNHDQR